MITFKSRVHELSSSDADFHLQNLLLEAGWNKSEDTQKDVERTLNCCGFSQANNSSCPAVSKTL